MERALRRLKKRLDREGVIRDVRAKRYFVKPAQAKRRKKKELDFNNMLRVRYSNIVIFLVVGLCAGYYKI